MNIERYVVQEFEKKVPSASKDLNDFYESLANFESLNTISLSWPFLPRTIGI